ncbi:MAG: monofunctional biosynthetic peptidoglycan transglycosylase [Ahrensia sp.]|nr:monofunctional biosynthetic peptidoglycan transglycosylase [Ahrensia sp.]
MEAPTGSEKKGNKYGGMAAKRKTKTAKRRSNGWLRRALRRGVRVLIILAVLAVALPVIITLFYKVDGVRPVSTLMAWNWVSGQSVRRDWVAFDDISPVVWQSVISSEDGQFCSHAGVDWAEINKVVDDALEGEAVRGASTIAMQTVKNLYLWPSRSYIRKAAEVPLALMVDAVWGKKRLMEIYLNIAEWGPGIYGIEAAARHHYGRSAARLSRRQAAMLTITLPNPILRNPQKPTSGMRRLARLVERRGRASGAYVACLK